MNRFVVALGMWAFVWAASATLPIAGADSDQPDPNGAAPTSSPDVDAPVPPSESKENPSQVAIGNPSSDDLFGGPAELVFVPTKDFSAGNTDSEFADIVPPFPGAGQPASKVGSDPITGTGNSRNVGVDAG